MALQDGTISGVVKHGQSKELRHSNFHFKTLAVDIHGNERLYNNENILDKYRDILMSHTNQYTFTDAEMETYRYRPRTFCLDIYINADLWSVLLRINNMLTCSDFNKKNIIVMNGKFVSVLKELMVLEDDRYEQERIKYKLR